MSFPNLLSHLTARTPLYRNPQVYFFPWFPGCGNYRRSTHKFCISYQIVDIMPVSRIIGGDGTKALPWLDPKVSIWVTLRPYAFWTAPELSPTKFSKYFYNFLACLNCFKWKMYVFLSCAHVILTEYLLFRITRHIKGVLFKVPPCCVA